MSRKKKKKLALVNMQSEHKSLPIASKPTAHQDRPPRFLRKPKAEAPNPPQSGCFAKLLEKLKVKFPSATAEELSPYIKKVRQSHGGSMCGLHMATIIQEVTHLMSSAEVRRRSRMPGSGITNQIKPNNVEYREEECPICIGSLREQKTRTLDCGHVFHDQ
uniref:Uncharacterized protein LOC102805928 n=1 Tax=Saccoglossus kowalevskii TaxID=10224 RepID=A0ABM0M5K6_SACKO